MQKGKGLRARREISKLVKHKEYRSITTLLTVGVKTCYDLNEFNSGCNERQRLEGEKGIINELVKCKEYRSITMLLIRLGLPRVTINGVRLSNYDRGV
jgi:hypothetical protein